MVTTQIKIVRLWKAASLLKVETLVRASKRILENASKSDDGSIVVDLGIFQPEEMCFLHDVIPQWLERASDGPLVVLDDVAVLNEILYGRIWNVAVNDPVCGFVPRAAALAAMEKE